MSQVNFDKLLNPHPLADDLVYRVAMTTHSGFYHYDLGDRVRVRGWFGQTPLLEFIGRAGLVSDLCGEKLTEDFVLTHLPIPSGFAMLAPSLQEKPHYVLFLDGAEYDEEGAIGLSRQCDRALAENPQYQYARELGQLGELVARRVENPMAHYIQHARERGQRLGDIKPPALRPETDWEEKFRLYPN
ncbi:MAG: GH3 auxin-responsive promoter family protein [Hormoscilla sp. GM102CHS1]|nr:GH3 auxin-responsive promoter family protein [Hormoscilla sp. GM102CHS1]